MVKKVLDGKSFDTAQWGIISLKGIELDQLSPQQKEKARHRLEQLVWRNTATIEVKGREFAPGIEAKVKVGKTDVNSEMKKFLESFQATN